MKVLEVAAVRHNTVTGYPEYQLRNEKGELYKEGVWMREKDLRLAV
jgi:hypothetical protein